MTSTFTELPDLAVRSLGDGVVAANDELFAEKEHLVLATDPTHTAATFGPRGQVYDGWETRRRREPGHDWVVVRLGVPGVVRGVVVDTAFFRGNYPPECSVEGCAVDGYPSPAELLDADWFPLVGRTKVQGDTQNTYAVDADTDPDGGLARLRCLGRLTPAAHDELLDRWRHTSTC